MRPELFRVDANNLTFAALRWGSPNAPLVLCLHGYPDTPWTWRHLGPHLAACGWRVVAPFIRGYAPTDLAPDDDYSVGAQARDAIALHQALGGDARAVLIGHDWGAAATYNVTAQTPMRFRHVVTMAVPPPAALLDAVRSPRALRVAGRQLRMSWYMAFNQLPGLAEWSQNKLIPKLWADWSPKFDAREELVHVFDAMRGRDRRRAALRYYRSLITPQGFKDGFLVNGKQPVLFLHGENDGCISPAISRRKLDLLATGSHAEYITDAGHFLHLERPELVNELITEWIGSPHQSVR